MSETVSNYSFLEIADTLEQNFLQSIGGGNNSKIDRETARDNFVKLVLNNLLPPTLHIGRGIVTDGTTYSAPHDIVLYRSDFPVLQFFGQNLYLIEGVLATIQLKTNLAEGSPNQLMKALEESMSVLTLANQAHILKNEGRSEAELGTILSQALNAQTFVVGCAGWTELHPFIENYRQAIVQLELKQHLPTAVWQPGMCGMRNDLNLVAIMQQASPEGPQELNVVDFARPHAFAIFLQRLMLNVTEKLIPNVSIAGQSELVLRYATQRYFVLPPINTEGNIRAGRAKFQV